MFQSTKGNLIEKNLQFGLQKESLRTRATRSLGAFHAGCCQKLFPASIIVEQIAIYPCINYKPINK